MRIGFIGLGAMGRGMASNIQRAGHELVVHELNRDAAADHLAAGAIWADSPRELAAQSELVFTSLPTPAVVESVGFSADGLAAGLRPGSAWFDLSTNAVDVVRRLAERLSAQEVHFMDAPVSGGPQGAASGRLAIWIGGDRATYERHRPVLDAMADQARYIGEIGAGTIAKLTHNCASAAISAVQIEVLTMGVKAGLDPLALFEAIRAGAMGRSRTFDKLATRFLPGKFDTPSFQLALLHKDLTLAMQLAREVAVPMRLCGLVTNEVTEALNRGWGGRDSQAFMLLQQERAGLEPIAVPQDAIDAVMART